MKKMNNKGFAITTLLYGLLLVAFLVITLLMSIMSTNRKNTSTLIKKIEEELNRYSQTATEITSTDGAQEFIVPYGKAGWYKIELWGGASSGVNTTLQTSAGRGSYTSGIIYLEENQHLYFHIGSIAGGSPLNNGATASIGGATDVRLVGGNWNDSTGLNSRIMVAGGGSKTSGTNYGYSGGFSTDINGGSYISGYGFQTAVTNYGFINPIMQNGVNPTSGKARIELISTNDKNNPPNKKSNRLNNVRYIKDCVKSTTAGTTYERWTEIQAFNSKGENVAYGKNAYYNGSTSNSISGLTNNSISNVSGTKSNSANTEHCVVIDLGTTHNLEEIVVYHNFFGGENNKYVSETISTSTTSLTSGFTTKKTFNGTKVPYETSHGVRISSRSLEDETIISGNFYIQSAKTENRVITSVGSNGILDLNNGEKTQHWTITPARDGFYKIVEASNELALQPMDAAQEIGEPVGTNGKYGEHNWEEWFILPVGNGYYQFKTRITTPYNLCITAPSARNTSGILTMEECNFDDERQWFRLINADY